MILDQEIIYKDNAALNDYASLNGYVSGSQAFVVVSAEDALFVGSELPFNHRYFKPGVVNTNVSEATVSVWRNRSDGWTSAVNVKDFTSLSGASLGQSGHISWQLDRDNGGWKKDDTDKMTGSGLETLKIYDKYWVRFTWDADFSAGTTLAFIGQKFATDDDLGVEYPDLNTARARQGFNNGASKADWEEQHIKVAEYIDRELRKNDSLRDEYLSRDQILRWEWFRMAAVHRLAALIYNAFRGGDDASNTEARDDAMKAFKSAMKPPSIKLDRDGDIEIDNSELGSGFKLERRG